MVEIDKSSDFGVQRKNRLTYLSWGFGESAPTSKNDYMAGEWEPPIYNQGGRLADTA